MRHAKDLTGLHYGKLTVLHKAPSPGYWRVRCSCGNEKFVKGASMMSGNTKSCGCLTRHNPGRPTKPKYTPQIEFGPFVQDADKRKAFGQMRRILAQHGVVVEIDGTLMYGNEREFKEKYPNVLIALGAALMKCITPLEVKKELIDRHS